MKKPSRTTFDERLNYMIEAIRAKITANEYGTGSYIPSILQLSKEYQLSINSVQKGLDVLLNEGLIERIPRVGIKVIAQHITTLSIGYYTTLHDELDLQYLIKTFEERYPTIKINLIPLHFSSYVETTEAYLKNELVDAVAINHLNFLHFSDMNQDLSQLFEPIQPKDGVYPFLNEAFTVNKQLFVQPVTFSAVVLCYNKEFFTTHQIPELPSNWTWNEFIKMLELIETKTSSNLSFYFYPGTWNRWPIFLMQSGLNFAEMPIELASEEILDSIETCYRLIHRQDTFSLLLSSNDTNVEKMFLEQSVPVMMTTYYRLNQLKETSFEFEIVPLPYVNEPKTLLLPIGFAMNQRSKKKELAKLFIDFVSSQEAQLHIRKHTYSIPAIQQAAEWEGEELFYRPTNFQMFKDITSQFGLISDLNLTFDQMQQLHSIMNRYWTGLQDKTATTKQLAQLTHSMQ